MNQWQKTNVCESNGAELEDVVQIYHACGIQWDEANIRNSVSVGETVHICVESQDGSRFDPNMTDEECFKLCKSKFHFRTSV